MGALTANVKPAQGRCEDMRLAVAKTELHTPATFERRNRDLVAAVRRHGVRYVGVDVAMGP